MKLPPEIEKARLAIEFQDALATHDVDTIARRLGVEPEAIDFVDAEGNHVDDGGDLEITSIVTIHVAERRKHFVVTFDAQEAEGG